jgi:hypothetical protein
MNPTDTWTIIERKMLELRILTNANWKNQEYELAVLGEKMLRSLEAAKAKCDSAKEVMARLPESITEYKNSRKLEEAVEAENLLGMKT